MGGGGEMAARLSWASFELLLLLLACSESCGGVAAFCGGVGEVLGAGCVYLVEGVVSWDGEV